MKLHVVHIFDSLGVGGLEKGVVTLTNHTSPDIQHTVICLRTTGPSADKLPVDVNVIALNKAPGNSFGFLKRLSAELKELSPDVVHTRNWGGMDGIIAARMAGIKNVVHGEHGWDLSDPQGLSLKRRLVRRFLSLGVREYVSVSKRIREWLENDVKVIRPVNQIYNGVDSELYCPDGDRSFLKTELGLSDKAKIIGIVARLDPIKDHHTLIKAFSLIADKYPLAHLVIVGDGSERQRLVDMSGKRIHFLGDRRDVSNIMRCFDIFALSSLNEGISNTILEAMSCGVPVVASDVGGNPELVRDRIDGSLFLSRDVDALISCFERYLVDPDLCRQHGENSRKRILANFSVQSMVNQYEDTWRRVADDS